MLKKLAKVIFYTYYVLVENTGGWQSCCDYNKTNWSQWNCQLMSKVSPFASCSGFFSYGYLDYFFMWFAYMILKGPSSVPLSLITQTIGVGLYFVTQRGGRSGFSIIRSQQWKSWGLLFKAGSYLQKKCAHVIKCIVQKPASEPWSNVHVENEKQISFIISPPW